MFERLKKAFCNHEFDKVETKYDIAREIVYTCKKCGFNYKNVV